MFLLMLFGCRDVLWDLSCLVDLFTFWSRRVFEVKPVTRGVSGGARAHSSLIEEEKKSFSTVKMTPGPSPPRKNYEEIKKISLLPYHSLIRYSFGSRESLISFCNDLSSIIFPLSTFTLIYPTTVR